MTVGPSYDTIMGHHEHSRNPNLSAPVVPNGHSDRNLSGQGSSVHNHFYLMKSEQVLVYI